MTAAELRAARDRLRLTQADLAQALGLARETVVRMERGKRPIPVAISLAVEALVRRAGVATTAR